MKIFLKKVLYAIFGLFLLLIAIGIIGSYSTDWAAIVLVVGFPAVLIIVFKSKLGAKTPQAEDEEISHTSVTVSVAQTQYTIPQRNKSKCRFLSKGESIVIHGHDIEGLVYVGSTSGPMEEPAVINPKLVVQKAKVTDPLGYWPGYSSISPTQRFRYLEWLSGDRGNNETLGEEMGYVFLYFYGFERYVLRDAKNDSDKDQNLHDVVVEIKRLRGLFAGNRSFDSYSNQLLDTIYILFWPDRINERKVAFPPTNPLAAKYAIAKVGNNSESGPLDADWALHWLLGYGPVSRTKTVREHYPILRSLFRAVYDTATKGGVTVPSCKTKLSLTITPASNELHDVAELPVPAEWCDPTGLKRPMTALVAIYEEVIPSLRLLAKSVAKKDTAGILAAWPPGIPTDSVPKLKKLVQSITAFFEKHTMPELGAIASLMGIELNDKATKSQLKQIASALETCGFSMAPDPLINSVTLKYADRVAVYKSSRIESLSPEGLWVALCVQLGSLLAMADGEVHTREKAILVKVINAHPNASERTYLINYLEWRLSHPPSTAGLKKQIDQLSDAQRDELAKILISLALADDHLSKSEIKQLEKLFSQLGLEPELVSGMLHSSSSSSVNNIVQISAPTANEKEPPAGVVLDEAALKAHSESTQEIQSVLSKIFVEEDQDSDTEALGKQSSDGNGHWYGKLLDHKHQALMVWLLTSDEWPMSAVKTKCQELELLSDGALETINNAAFDALGDGLLEIGETVEVYRDVLPA